jgi:hypothetical protein
MDSVGKTMAMEILGLKSGNRIVVTCDPDQAEKRYPHMPRLLEKVLRQNAKLDMQKSKRRNLTSPKQARSTEQQ